MENVVLDYQSPQTAVRPLRAVTLFEAFYHVVFGVLLPIGCFVVGTIGHLGKIDLYQSGKSSTYAMLLITEGCSWPFYPLLAWSMFCIVAMCVAPVRASGSSLIRLGLDGGVVLAFTFLGIEASALDHGVPLAALGVAIAGILVLIGSIPRRLSRKFGDALVSTILIGFVAISFALLSLTQMGRIVALQIGFALLMTGPVFTLSSTLALAGIARRTAPGVKPTSMRNWLALRIVWLSGYVVAWQFAVAATMREYEKLPKNPPSCYIATAAARGHRSFVGSWETVLGDGSIVCVNDQLCRLKAGELILRTLVPKLHRTLRIAYDFAGPKLARRMRHPLLADAAYLALKPIEYATVLLTRLVFPGVYPRIRALY